MQKNRILLLVLVIYLAPILFYGVIFGPKLSRDHEVWSEFGSAMAGIYAPIIALTTLFVLARQTDLQSQINNHQYDQAYIVQARSDIDFYAAQLSQKLEGFALPGVTIKQFLHNQFQGANLADFDAGDRRILAANFNATSPSIFSMWTAIYPIFGGLETKDEPFFNMTKQSALQKLIAILSFETCVCLENYHRVRTEGNLVVPYQFSARLCRNSGP